MATTPIHEQLWSQCLRIIASKVTGDHYNTWFAPIKCQGFDEKSHMVTLGVPSPFFSEWIEEHFINLLSTVLRHVFGEGVSLQYSVMVDSTHGIQSNIQSVPPVVVDKKTKGRAGDRQLVPDSVAGVKAQMPELDTHLNPELTFETFVEGSSNKMPLTVALSVAANPEQQNFNPLFIYGHSGVGKTHLVNAIGLRCKQLHPHKRVLYVSAHLFQVQYVDAQTRDNRLNDFMHFYQTIDVLIVDDIQEFQGMRGTLSTFFHIFNHLRMNGKQIILTCDRPPMELRDMEERLLTRFKWGLQCEIEKPSFTLRHDILKAKIRRDGLVIDDRVVRYIARNVSDSVRDLEGVVNSLMAHSVCLGREIDMAMAEQVVRSTVKIEREPVTIERIMQGVADSFAVTPADIMSASRKANVARARQVVMFLAARMADLSSTRIGALIGNRSHATVLHSIRQAETIMTADPDFREKVENIRVALQSRN